MTRLGAEAWLAAAAIWLSIMLPSAAFGRDGGADAAPSGLSHTLIHAH
jgi:hypothetical protein